MSVIPRVPRLGYDVLWEQGSVSWTLYSHFVTRTTRSTNSLDIGPKSTRFIHPSGNPGEKAQGAPLFAAARPPPLDDGNWIEKNTIPLTLSPLDGFGTESPLVSSLPPSKAPPHARIHCTWLGSLVRELGHPTAGPQMSWHREELNPFCDPTRKHSLLLASPGCWDRSSHLFIFAIESPRRAGCLVVEASPTSQLPPPTSFTLPTLGVRPFLCPLNNYIRVLTGHSRRHTATSTGGPVAGASSFYPSISRARVCGLQAPHDISAIMTLSSDRKGPLNSRFLDCYPAAGLHQAEEGFPAR
ncbi:predicted protein [Chaetomium globosum CBS 148.51]|uniref:Uncharacterized protein n=1 Tax=Chaetomium globosum (strain ATCC 6205 / CBS 148.51 / DSM 1962 / NBRC 6347 / NRRL 1970) TaxID=306901 RepID=Q2HB21_CHAGB|nr:uncharacterized protein CHGG_02583 [Chaetomium globosum CBS 148.51]EAQ90648.1 predicted protein [Chaetomium globosum CBS 148.51]